MARFVGSADFWRGLVIAVLAVMVVWLYLQNRSLIDQQNDALVSYCNTQRVLEAGFRQLRAIDERLVIDPGITLQTRSTINQRLIIYSIMLAEFSKTKPCEQIE